MDDAAHWPYAKLCNETGAGIVVRNLESYNLTLHVCLMHLNYMTVILLKISAFLP